MSAGLKLHADLSGYIHRLRDREMEIIFGRCPPKLFPRVLEVGAGDGHQARHLQRYAEHLTCTDYSAQWFTVPEHEHLAFRACDGEQLDAEFPERHFDLIFSSNVFEHLPNPTRALRGMHRILADDGVLIHVMPSPFWACVRAALYLPHQAARSIEAVTAEGMTGLAVRMRNRISRDAKGTAIETGQVWDNNPKTPPPSRSRLARLLLPPPHGVSATLRDEIRAFSPACWAPLFQRCDLDLIAVQKGPAGSGYGFGFDRLRGVCDRLGLASEYIYVAVKRGHRSRFAAYLQPAI